VRKQEFFLIQGAKWYQRTFFIPESKQAWFRYPLSLVLYPVFFGPFQVRRERSTRSIPLGNLSSHLVGLLPSPSPFPFFSEPEATRASHSTQVRLQIEVLGGRLTFSASRGFIRHFILAIEMLTKRHYPVRQSALILECLLNEALFLLP
jgi:hypothetical protein